MTTRFKTLSTFGLAALLVAGTACQGTGSAAELANGQTMDQAAMPNSGEKFEEGTIVVALKFVNYQNDEGKPVATESATKEAVKGMNAIYKQCGVAFVAEDIIEVTPKNRGLEYSLSSMGELDPTRAEFAESDQLVVINTGPWSMGGSANAWAKMPGSSEEPLGAVLEESVAADEGITAHEVGHYLNLDHASDEANLMNPVIYKTSRALSAEQCATVRETATGILREATRS